MNGKKIIVAGKTIDYENMDDESLLKLYNQLIERQKKLTEISKKTSSK